jgi:hypothetical protein
VYDGHNQVQRFDDLALKGDLLSKGRRNTFEIRKDPRHLVEFGIGLSFFVRASIPIDHAGPPPQGHLLVAAAGADFETRGILAVLGRNTVDLLLRRIPGWFRHRIKN